MFLEDLRRHVHGRDLQLLLGAEMREQAALAHLQLFRQASDAEALQPFDRGQVHGNAQNPLPGALTLGTGRDSGGGRHRKQCRYPNKIARTFVFVPYSSPVPEDPLWLACFSCCSLHRPSHSRRKFHSRTATSCPWCRSAFRARTSCSWSIPRPLPCSTWVHSGTAMP